MSTEAARSLRPRPASPGPDAEQLRSAYLDLLRLALCDMVASETETVVKNERGYVSHPLPEEEIGQREVGRDWPLRGLTMVGYKRLGDLQECLENIVADGIEGDVIEAGVWRGGASIFARATLDSLGEHDRKVWLADSFAGLPQPDPGAFPEDHESTFHDENYLAVPESAVLAGFERLGLDHDLEFVKGFFSDTMPQLTGRTWALIRLDGDMYESTWVTLESLYPGLARGGYLIVDDYGAVEQCKQAVDDFREAHGITAPLEEIDWTCVRWRRDDDPQLGSGGEPQRRREAPFAAEPPPPANVLTHREAALLDRVQELERELAERQTRRRRLLRRR